jgi:hypothetical protein
MTLKVLVLAGTACLLALPAAAHHSFAMFDHAKTVKLTGQVKEVEWINPHTWIHMTAPGKDGKPVTWSFEAGSIGQLVAAGWKKDDVKVGERIEMGFHPLKDGSYGGQVLTVALPDGRSLCQGRECEGARGGGGE